MSDDTKSATKRTKRHHRKIIKKCINCDEESWCTHIDTCFDCSNIIVPNIKISHYPCFYCGYDSCFDDEIDTVGDAADLFEEAFIIGQNDASYGKPMHFKEDEKDINYLVTMYIRGYKMYMFENSVGKLTKAAR